MRIAVILEGGLIRSVSIDGNKHNEAISAEVIDLPDGDYQRADLIENPKSGWIQLEIE